MKDHFLEISSILAEFINDANQMKYVEDASILMARCIMDGSKIISCGNGGSMADAMHFAEELTGRFREDRTPYPAIAISDPTYLTCVANDYGFDNVFSRFIQATGKHDDLLLAISTSGNSSNVIKAAKMARHIGMKVVTLTGKDGGTLSGLATVDIRAPYSKYADHTQEIHGIVIHSLIRNIERICR